MRYFRAGTASITRTFQIPAESVALSQYLFLLSAKEKNIVRDGPADRNVGSGDPITCEPSDAEEERGLRGRGAWISGQAFGAGFKWLVVSVAQMLCRSMADHLNRHTECTSRCYIELMVSIGQDQHFHLLILT